MSDGRPPAGLCGRCRHARRIESDRGSVFLLCALSRTDSRYARYPRLPMWRCPGFETADPAPPDSVGDPPDDGTRGLEAEDPEARGLEATGRGPEPPASPSDR